MIRLKIWLPFLLAAWVLQANARPPREDFTALPEVRSFISDMASRHGFSRSGLQRQFSAARKLPGVIRAIQPPADPGIRSWHSYRDRFIEPRRIALGLAFARTHQAALQRAEAQYGVPADIILAIIGVETIYGRHVGSYPTFSALATLAFHYPPRAQLFRNELEALLLLAREQHRNPLAYRGSYAGALGLPQFLPSSQRRWAVDFDSDGRVDLGSAVDAIGSVAHFLHWHGWQKDGPILAPAQLSAGAGAEAEAKTGTGAGIQALIDEGIYPVRLPQALRSFGVETGDVPQQPAALIDYVTPAAPTEYRLGYRNFYVITRYNRSSFYATAVNDLAEALRSAQKESIESEK